MPVATTACLEAQPLLQAQGLQAGYGSAVVLNGVSLQLNAGEVVGLLGRNGMGKTTLVRTLMGVLKPSAGQVRVAGQPLAGLPPHAIACLGLALVPEGRQVFTNLSVEEHLSAFVRLTLQGAMPRETDFKQTLYADNNGVSLHAAVPCAAEDCQALEQLCRYVTRPALANECVRTNAAGQVVLKLNTPWRDGTTHLVMSPLEFMQRLAVLVPPHRGPSATKSAFERLHACQRNRSE